MKGDESLPEGTCELVPVSAEDPWKVLPAPGAAPEQDSELAGLDPDVLWSTT